MITSNRTAQEFEAAGYTVIRLFKDYYLIRRYSKNYKKFSVYLLTKVQKEKN